MERSESVGIQYSLEGSGLVLGGDRPTPEQEVLSGINPDPGRLCDRTSGEESSEESEIDSLPGTIVHSPEERLSEGKGDSRSINTEQINRLSELSDADGIACKDIATPWGRHNYYRSYRRLLARSYSKAFYSLSGVQTRKSELCIQSNAIRSEHSSQNFHEISGVGGTNIEESGDSSRRLSRRLDSVGPLRGGMYPIRKEGDGYPSGSGLQDQCQEVQTDSGKSIPVAGSSLGSSVPHLISSEREEKTNSKADQTISSNSSCDEEGPRKSIRLSPVCISDRYNVESPTQGHEQGVEEESSQETERQEEANATDPEKKTKTLDDGKEPVQVSTPPSPSAISDDSYRRVIRRLGRSFSHSKRTRKLVSKIQEFSHKYLGGDGGVPISKEIETGEEYSHTTGTGQPSDGPLHKQGRVEEWLHQSCEDSHLLISQEEELAPLSSPHRGSPECDSGLPIQSEATGVRMESGYEIIPVGTMSSPGFTNRPFRDGTEPQASVLYSTEPGPSGIRHRRNVSGLESMGEDLCVPSSQSSDEGPSQASLFQRHSGSDSPLLAEEQLVSSHARTQSQTHENTCSGVKPGSANEDCIRFILDNDKLTFTDFLTYASKRRYDIDYKNIAFVEKDKEESTLRQYTSAFRKLAEFIKQEKPKEMSINLAISFFRSIFDKGLAASTINTVRSALVKVFLYGFDIDLNGIWFASISKACAKLRPSERPTMFSWSLNKVLELASGIDNNSCSYQKLLRKVLFLFALASGARVSEIAAISRDKGYVNFLPSGEVKVSPHPKFFAKNEDRQKRWSPWSIVPLPQDPSLCPVQTLRDYLNRTEQWQSGRLFRREKGATLTIDGVRQQILYFIKEADPDSVPKPHEVRALATSVNYFQYMDFSALTKYTGWKSPRVFMKHYFRDIESLKFHSVAAGKVVAPSDDC